MFNSESRRFYLAVSVDRFHKLHIHQRASGIMRQESEVVLLSRAEVKWLKTALDKAVMWLPAEDAADPPK